MEKARKHHEPYTRLNGDTLGVRMGIPFGFALGKFTPVVPLE
jgi:hypothetical protein